MGNQHSNMAHKDRQNHHFGHHEEYHLEIPDMVDDRFKVESRLGAGSFGVLHEGVNVETNQPVAIKLEPGNCRVQQLHDEYRIYRLLGGAAGFPNVYYYGHKGGYNIMVMDLLGPNLDELFGLCDHRFSQKTVVMLAKRMLRLLQVVHDLGLIYRDVKPDNFLIGRPKTDTANALFMIDFGMSKPYRDEKTGAHIPFRERGCISGTARYMSLNAHEGGEQSRRDDLESLGYVLLYLLRGSLPWQGVKEANQEAKYERIEELKRKTSIAQLCAGFTVEFSIYLHYVRKLKFDEDPDYDFCESLFDKALKRLDAQDDEEYDWMLINDGKGWEASDRKKKEPLMLTY